ncbi:hypothetical protein L227DRAFT_575099 [Lentinus tigrinus ALCF2SS1-6]|uniref:Uncharacterized protein n=1 Tax=Lentinus tigrinus ALCF2SS1-6 TaxID=1328759 RepID=A0A5C2S9J6_9APHY|nr:hypothetical protein L227DRAFT_575099 [Lentinus tigrinus ALCF2SS1-6]
MSLSLWCLSYRIATSRTPPIALPIALYYPCPIYYACQKPENTTHCTVCERRTTIELYSCLRYVSVRSGNVVASCHTSTPCPR